MTVERNQKGDMRMKNKLLAGVATGLFMLGMVGVANAATIYDTTTNFSIVDGLIAHWAFNGNANDVTGNGHNGTVNGAGLTTDRFGNANSAYSFDGNDYIAAADSADFTLGSNPFTIAAWSKISAFSSDGGYYFMGHDEGPGNTDKWIFFQGNSGIKFITSPTGWVSLGTYNFQVDDWHHLVVRRDGNLLTAFVDGVPIGDSVFSSTIPNPSASFLIGDAESQHSGRNYRGAIDDVRIYDRALSSTEIQALAAVPIPAGIWLFLSGILSVIAISKRKKVQ